MSQNARNVTIAAILAGIVFLAYGGPSIFERFGPSSPRVETGVSTYSNSEDRLQLGDGTFELDFVLPTWFKPDTDLAMQMNTTGSQDSFLTKRLVQLLPIGQSSQDYTQSFQIDIAKNVVSETYTQVFTSAQKILTDCSSASVEAGNITAGDRSLLVVCTDRNGSGQGDVTAIVQSNGKHVVQISETWRGPAFELPDKAAYPVDQVTLQDAFDRLISLRQK